MAEQRFLNSMYENGNKLREIADVAREVTDETKIPVLFEHVGNPSGPTFVPSNRAMAEYLLERPGSTGYAHSSGNPEMRAEVAEAITVLNRLPKDSLKAENIFCVTGGTGGLNIALSVFGEPPVKAAVLVSDPYYPPWEPITKRNNGEIHKFDLRAEDGYLLNEEILSKKIEQIRRDDEDRGIKNRPIVLMYHYPHNPTGKVLTKGEAEDVATTLNRLVEKFDNLHLVQEDLYLATTRSDMGIYTPLQHLSPEAMSRTAWVHSPSKEGHGEDRGAIIATTDPALMKVLGNSAALAALGMATASLVGTAETLSAIALGRNPKSKKLTDDPELVEFRRKLVDSGKSWARLEFRKHTNHRYQTADYYQERLAIAGQAFIDLQDALKEEKRIDTKMLDLGIPQGTYYLWPSLKELKNQPIPEEYRKLEFKGEKLFDHDTIQTPEDIQKMLLHAYALGLQPISVAPGDLFTDNKEDIRLRIATVDRTLEKLHDVANTIKGVVGTTMELNLDKLGVEKFTTDQLKDPYHITKAARLGYSGPSVEMTP